MLWADVVIRRAVRRDVDPSEVAVIVAPSMSYVEVWCRDHGRSRPGRRDALIAVTNMDNAQRIRGMSFASNAELVVLDRYRCKGSVVEEAEALFRVAKVRGSARIPRGESETFP